MSKNKEELAIQQVTEYKTEDGKQFKTFEKAYNHCKTLEIVNAVLSLANYESYEVISTLLNKGYTILPPLEKSK